MLEPRAGRVVVLASYNRDQSMVLERLPVAGETVIGHSFLTFHGGKGSNQAVQAARCGGKVSVIAALGNDAAGEAAQALWRREGISAERTIVDAQTATGVALILVDEQGSNQIAIAPGANLLITADSMPLWGDDLAAADVVVAQLECGIEAALAAFRLARAHGSAITILNAAPTCFELPEELWRCTDVLIVNDIEARALAPGAGTEPEALAARLVERIAKAVIVTAGEKGAFLCAHAVPSEISMAPPAVSVIDTTGAGDAFVGAFAAVTAQGGDVGEAVAWGVAAGALACTRRGAVAALPAGDEIRSCLAGLSAQAAEAS